jgi:hypothetical protein
MEIAFIIFLGLVVNTVTASYAKDLITNIYLRRLMVIPPFGLIGLTLISIVFLTMLAIVTIKEIWD